MRSFTRICMLACVLLGGADVWAKDPPGRKPNLPTLRRKLLEVHAPEQIGGALDDLQKRIGVPGWFKDHGAFGDWLATLPDGRDKHPVVQQRRGWAYMVSKRGKDAIAPLEVALKDDPSSGLTRAYLGESLRQAGRFEDAIAMLTRAAECGFTESYLTDGVMQSALALRQTKSAKQAKALPAYARAVSMFLEQRPGAVTLRHFVVTSLVKDLEAFEDPSQPRGMLWIETAASHLLQIADAEAMGPKLLQKIARLSAKQGTAQGRATAFELFSWAVRRSYVPENDSHRLLETLLDLAEAAITQSRYALARRLIEARLARGLSPRAGRLARQLPPDMDVR